MKHYPPELMEQSDTFCMTAAQSDAIHHCQWAYRSGQTPRVVMASLGRPHDLNTSWADAIRAVEAVHYANKLAAVREADNEFLASL